MNRLKEVINNLWITYTSRILDVYLLLVNLVSIVTRSLGTVCMIVVVCMDILDQWLLSGDTWLKEFYRVVV
jgi:hypothetical protein